MILLNTNVVSEPLRRKPEARVIEWIDAQALETLYISTITVAELRCGIALLPAGKRRQCLLEDLEKRVLPLFAGRVLSFDLNCTQVFAEMTAKAHKTGLEIATTHLLTVAIAVANGFAVATQNPGPIEAAGAIVISPWKE